MRKKAGTAVLAHRQSVASINERQKFITFNVSLGGAFLQVRNSVVGLDQEIKLWSISSLQCTYIFKFIGMVLSGHQ